MAVQQQLFSENNMGFSCVYPQDLVFNYADHNNGFSTFQENLNTTPPPQHVYKALPPKNAILVNNNQSAAASSSSSSTALLFSSMDFFPYLASELDKQRAEIDSFLQIQNEKLSKVVQEETRQRGVLLQRYSSHLMSFIRQKEYDLAVANARTMELQECLRRASIESKAWQNKAAENESLALNLTNKMKQVKEKMLLSQSTARDEESHCGSPYCDTNDNKCSACHAQMKCVIFFPCRHLCCCTDCEAFLGFCPLCHTVKQESMEVFFG